MRKLDIIMHGARVCNGLCAYCCSRENINKEKDDITIDEEVVREYLKKYKPEKVQIWGTEPLMHFEELNRLVQLTRETIPNAHIGVSSNGILIKKYVSWILENLDGIQISWDGLAQHLRTGWDFLQDDEDIIRLARSGKLYINCVLHGKNTDVKGNIEYFENWEKKVGRTVRIRFSLLMPGDNGESAYKYPYLFLKECKKYISHRYFHKIRKDVYRFSLHAGMVSCFRFAHTHTRTDMIDTLGKPCPCNLLDSSQTPGNPLGKKLEECKDCIYKDTRFCNSCVSNPLEKKCIWNKAYNTFLESLTNKV